MLKISQRIWRRRRHERYIDLTGTDRKRKIAELFVVLIILAFVHLISMMLLEGFSFEDAIWFTMTTITTVGYGDVQANSLPGRLVTILLMYLFGIFLLAQIVGEVIDYRIDMKERKRKGLWSWNMKNHIVIINTPDTDGARYLQALAEQIRKTVSLEDYPIQILSPNYPDGLPAELASLGVVLRQGQPEGRAKMTEVDIENAAFIIVLAFDANDYRSDSLTLDVLDQLEQFDLPGYIIAEGVQDENRSRLRAHGADAVLRPIRAYPELLVRAMVAPGTETILEDLFQHQGAHPRRYEVEIPAQKWGEMAARIVLNGLGTPLGYIDRANNLITNPDAAELVDGSVLFLLVNHNRIPDIKLVGQCVAEKG